MLRFIHGSGTGGNTGSGDNRDSGKNRGSEDNRGSRDNRLDMGDWNQPGHLLETGQESDGHQLDTGGRSRSGHRLTQN